MKLSILAVLFATVAGAATLNGTLGWVPQSNTVSFVGSTLGSSTMVSIPALESINALPPLFQGAPNDFVLLVALGNGVAIADPSLAVAHINGGFFGDPLPAYAQFASGNRFEFDVASVEWSTSAPTNLSLLVEGTLIDHLGIFSPTLADVSGSFTTTGSGAVNASFTLTTEVPETPIGIVGVALCAIVFRRKRRE